MNVIYILHIYIKKKKIQTNSDKIIPRYKQDGDAHEHSRSEYCLGK